MAQRDDSRRAFFAAVVALVGVATVSLSCSTGPQPDQLGAFDPDYSERFADLKVIQYEVPGFDRLSLDQKKLVYYLSQATLAGRDIFYDQSYRHNLRIRKTIEAILTHLRDVESGPEWEEFSVYAKRVFFSNGIHHHYSESKIIPNFSPDFFRQLISQVPARSLPLDDGMSGADLADFLVPILFDPRVDAKRVNKEPGKDLIQTSATNYYRGLTQDEAEAYYARARAGIADPQRPVLLGVNSQLIKLDGAPAFAYRIAGGIPGAAPGPGDVVEYPWCLCGPSHPSGLPGLYSAAVEQIVYWLDKAVVVAENEAQRHALELLIEFYTTGDLQTWDEYNIAWVQATEGDIDYINGFIEVYKDPLGYKGYFEGIVQMTDQEASERIRTLSAQAQWFEDRSPIRPQHRRPDVKGISARVVTVAMEGGAAAPNTPIGVNLPNSNWIRSEHGSKSVSLDNIKNAYDRSASAGALEEFAFSDEEMARSREHGMLSAKLKTDLHEVIGHASGRLNPGVGIPAETLKSYARTLEEARADLVALYFIVDPKLVELGVMPSVETGRAEYETYLRNGLMQQLRRIQLGDDLEQDHMRNRQMTSLWAYELGRGENIIERVEREGKTYFVVRDFDRLREIFGEMLREVQRIKSEGDYEAGRSLVETYGVKIDRSLHEEVLRRYEALNDAPYTGFLQPELVAVRDGETLVDVRLGYAGDFVDQMLAYGREYAYLPLQPLR